MSVKLITKGAYNKICQLCASLEKAYEEENSDSVAIICPMENCGAVKERRGHVIEKRLFTSLHEAVGKLNPDVTFQQIVDVAFRLGLQKIRTMNVKEVLAVLES